MAKNNYDKNRGLNSLHLRIIGIIGMLGYFLLNTGIEGISNHAAADCMQWFSCTIFAFLLAEGVNNTSNRLLYIRRFIVFAILSEPAYDLYTSGKPWDPDHQSFMMTLLLSLFIMMICDYLKRRFNNTVLDVAAVAILAFWSAKLGNILNCEFCGYGIMLGMVFYLSHDLTYKRLFEAAIMVYALIGIKTDSIISITFNRMQYKLPITVFALFAFILTWFYNKQRGSNHIVLKIVFYLVYPICLLAFYFLNIFLK